MDSFEKIKKVLAEELGLEEDEITLESDLIEDLGADSLTLVELVMDFESEYDITVPDEALESIKTVGDIVDKLNELGI